MQKSFQRFQVRIIGGRWRGRKLTFADQPGLRPSGDRMRETLFNWLMPHLADARVLDLFAGSGALGLEALSRGATHAVLVESSRAAAACLQKNAAALQANCEVVCAEAINWLQRPCSQPFDIVFIDPPFDAGLLPSTLELLVRGGWLAPDAAVYMEFSSSTPAPTLPHGWQLRRELKAGQVRCQLAFVGDAGML